MLESCVQSCLLTIGTRLSQTSASDAEGLWTHLELGPVCRLRQEIDIDALSQQKTRYLFGFAWRVVWEAIRQTPRGYYVFLCDFDEDISFDGYEGKHYIHALFRSRVEDDGRALLARFDYHMALRVCLLRRGLVSKCGQCCDRTDALQFEINPIASCDAISMDIENIADRIADVSFAKREATGLDSHVWISGDHNDGVWTCWIIVANGSPSVASLSLRASGRFRFEDDDEDPLHLIRYMSSFESHQKHARLSSIDSRWQSMQQFATLAQNLRIPNDIVNRVREFVCCGMV